MPIPDIRLNNIRIRDVVIHDVPKWMSSDPPVALPAVPPVTMEVGTPIVNIPGCVEAHKDNSENVNLKNEDDKGVMTALNLLAGLANMGVFLGGYILGTETCLSTNK